MDDLRRKIGQSLDDLFSFDELRWTLKSIGVRFYLLPWALSRGHFRLVYLLFNGGIYSIMMEVVDLNYYPYLCYLRQRRLVHPYIEDCFVVTACQKGHLEVIDDFIADHRYIPFNSAFKSAYESKMTPVIRRLLHYHDTIRHKAPPYTDQYMLNLVIENKDVKTLAMLLDYELDPSPFLADPHRLAIPIRATIERYINQRKKIRRLYHLCVGFIECLPPGYYSCLPNGGVGYVETSEYFLKIDK